MYTKTVNKFTQRVSKWCRWVNWPARSRLISKTLRLQHNYEGWPTNVGRPH